ncbi:transcription factor bHLH68 isoform X1 [Lactuca sativa]|uniref:transcription factor bHLH68 isoform X1 n=1 Tax=Lactuca sativa TaxID=4236 RepID=UPI000CD8FF32|nr:transcription factor bHLH68 isoform X1 [Lactuca sativa]
MMGENPNYWWSLNGRLQPPPSQQVYPTFLSTPPLPVPVAPPSSVMNPPYLFGSSLLLPAANSNTLGDHHHHHDNQDFPVSWSQLLLTGLANDQEHNLGDGHGGEVKHGFLDHQRRQLFYDNNPDHHENNNEEDLQTCSSSWSPQINPVPSVGSSSTMSLSTTTMVDFSSKIDRRNHNANQYSSQYDDTSTSGASKKPRFQSSSTQPSTMQCNDTFTSGASKRTRAQHSSTQTPLKVRKEKLGDRISALHQLVSPFGKTDTASVLFEATAHIRFLEGQIEALSSPYMNLANNVSGGTRHQHSADGKAPLKDLGSRGLCLVPTTYIDHIDTTNMTSNGAEFWTPAFGGGL